MQPLVSDTGGSEANFDREIRDHRQWMYFNIQLFYTIQNPFKYSTGLYIYNSISSNKLVIFDAYHELSSGSFCVAYKILLVLK